MSGYQFLKSRFAQIKNLGSASGILQKDAETVMAPGSSKNRVQQQMAIGQAIHMLITDPRVEEALEEARLEKLGAEDSRNLELMYRKWVHQAGIPADLAAEISRVEEEGCQIHTKSYGSGDWPSVQDWYEHSFDIAREAGDIKKEKLGLASSYEALIDQYNPGMRVSVIDAEFATLDLALRPMIREALENQKSKKDVLPLDGPFALDAQEKINRDMAQAVGFDFNRGVHYMIKGHPSMAGCRDDTRMTTRLDERNLLSGIYATIHETGHAVYEQNLPEDWMSQPAGAAVGMHVHETQSMIMEYQAGMSREFLEFLSRRMQETFNDADNPAFKPENIQALKTQVRPSFIRISADEMTYPMHIILRYDLERKIISRALDIKDLPDAWSDGLYQRLGIRPSNPSEGCMQDIHWPAGAIGYFPAYAFGAMGAAQFFEAALKAHPEILKELGQGTTTTLRQWLRENVHGKGSLLDTDQLFMQATGAPLNARPYLNHLANRYLGRAYQ